MSKKFKCFRKNLKLCLRSSYREKKTFIFTMFFYQKIKNLKVQFLLLCYFRLPLAAILDCIETNVDFPYTFILLLLGKLLKAQLNIHGSSLFRCQFVDYFFMLRHQWRRNSIGNLGCIFELFESQTELKFALVHLS